MSATTHEVTITAVRATSFGVEVTLEKQGRTMSEPDLIDVTVTFPMNEARAWGERLGQTVTLTITPEATA